MPPRVKVLSPTELAVARDDAYPSMYKISNLLLRSGPRGFVEFQAQLRAECAKEVNSQSASGYAHINPEGFKNVCKECGVLLSPEDYQKIFVAYGDPVGFVMLDPLLADLGPTNGLKSSALSSLRKMFPPAMTVSETPDGGKVEKLPPVSLSSVLDNILTLLAPVEGDCTADVALNNTNAVLQSMYEDAQYLFSLEKYPSKSVPSLDVMSFLAAFLQLLPMQTGGQDAVKLLLERLETLPALTVAPQASTFTDKDGRAYESVMTHEGVRSERKFERYQDGDRRDEWLRGRNEGDAGESYQKHVVGYGGHLPEYRYHFGRTFHVIEEDLPRLSKPKPQQEPTPPDAYGKPIELKYSRMSEHHHKFA